MDTTAISRFVRVSPLKARGLARRVQGLPVAEALRVTELTAGKAAFWFQKTLRSAIANADHNANVQADSLVVKACTVEEGPRLRRWWARARGSASPIQRRTSHIRIVLTDGVEVKQA